MATNQTSGYDVVLELSERRIQQMITSLNIVPVEVNRSFTYMGGSLPLSIQNITIRNVNLRPGEQLTVSARAGNISAISLPLGGANITLETRIGVDVSASGFRLNFTFPSLPVITLDDPILLDNLVSLARAAGTSITAAQVMDIATNELHSYLQSHMLLPEIPNSEFGSEHCSLNISELVVRTTETSIFFAALLNGADIAHPVPTDPAGFEISFLGMNDAVLLLSNESLLSLSTCYLTTGNALLEGSRFTASPNARELSEPNSITYNGMRIEFQQLRIAIVGNEIEISGRLQTAGTGWWARGTFRAPIGIRTERGLILPVLNPDRVETYFEVGFEWWVYLLGITLAPVAGLILGPLVGVILSIVVALLAPISAAILNVIGRSYVPGLGELAERAVHEGYALLPPELINIIGSVNLEGVVLDDLAMLGTHVGPSIIRAEVQQNWSNPQEELIDTEVTGLFLRKTYRVSWAGTLRVITANIPGTLRFAWFYNNRPLRGNGTMPISDGSGNNFTFRVSGATCRISSAENVDLVGIISVRVTGSTGALQTVSLLLDKTGLQTRQEFTFDLRAPFHDSYFFEDVIRWRGPQPDPSDLNFQAFNVRNLQPQMDLVLLRNMQINLPNLRNQFGG